MTSGVSTSTERTHAAVEQASFGRHNLALIPAVQHVLGLVMAGAIYVLLLRYRVRRWLAALATAPVLLDGYQLQIEETVASDTFFQALVVAALLVLLWKPPPSNITITVVGLLVGMAATVRFVGLPLLVAPLLYILAVEAGWQRRVLGAGTLVVAAAVPLLVYSSWTYVAPSSPPAFSSL